MITDPEKRFTGLPVTTEYIDGHLWRLARDASYRSRSGRVSTVRRGFVFDWASIPWVFRLALPAAGKTDEPYGIGALWHDWLYRHGAIDGRPIRRKTADRLLLEIMLYTGVRAPLALLIYSAVRLGGRHAWRHHRRNDKKRHSEKTPSEAPQSIFDLRRPDARVRGRSALQEVCKTSAKSCKRSGKNSARQKRRARRKKRGF